jgi:hypothetical protein
MKIAQSSMVLDSAQFRSSSVSVREHLQAWVGERPAPPGAATGMSTSSNLLTKTGTLSLLTQGLSDWAPYTASSPLGPTHQAASPGATQATAALDDPAKDTSSIDPRMLTLARMIEAITGQPVRLVNLGELQAPSQQAVPAALPSGATPAAAPAPAGNAASGWGLVYERSEMRTEQQQVQVQAQGTVHTTDGRTISIRLDLSMSSTHTESSQVSLRAGDAVLKDPLVINFDGPLGQLSNTRFSFDLDADGKTEAMPFVGQGSGFLALDRNGNGGIDDGRELFGALSGNGFADLAPLDDDGNGWIDAGDAVFTKLQVWRMGDQGKPTLTALADTDVGALYLGHVSSELTLRDGSGTQQGQLRSTGLYLTNAGQAGTLQQVDLVV